MDRQRLADSDQYLIPALLGQQHRIGPRVSGAVRESARSSHGQGRARKRSLGCRSRAEAGSRYGSCWAARAARFLAASRLAFRIRSSSCSKKFRSNWLPATAASKSKSSPGWDVNVLERIRSRWADITLSCDANSAYTLDQVEHLRKFDQFNLLMIEQPLWNDDIYYHARLQKELRTSICLDESIVSVRSAAFAVETGACRIINIKVGRVGGFTEALKIHDLCQAHKIPVWCGGMLETGIGRAHNIALSTLENFSLPGDVSASKRYWKEDIIDPEVEVSPQGMIAISDQPGTGYRVKEDLIENLTVRKETLRAR